MTHGIFKLLPRSERGIVFFVVGHILVEFQTGLGLQLLLTQGNQPPSRPCVGTLCQELQIQSRLWGRQVAGRHRREVPPVGSSPTVSSFKNLFSDICLSTLTFVRVNLVTLPSVTCTEINSTIFCKIYCIIICE
jgi:hypothetical protein